MDPIITGGLISGIGSIASGLLSGKATKDANQKNYNAQKEFAKMGVRWKVDDAKAAGLHPLYALGANTHSFSPSFVGDQGLAQGVSNAGQDLGRAIGATKTQPERDYDDAMRAENLKNARLQNKLLEGQVIGLHNRPTNPALPSNSEMTNLTKPGGYVKETQLERIHSEPGQAGKEVGAVPTYQYGHNDFGLGFVPSRDFTNVLKIKYFQK